MSRTDYSSFVISIPDNVHLYPLALGYRTRLPLHSALLAPRWQEHFAGEISAISLPPKNVLKVY